MDLSVYFLLFTSCLFTAGLSAVVGMAGGVTLLALLSFFFEVPLLIGIHAIIQLVSNSYRCFLMRDFILKDQVYPYMLGLPFGSLVFFIVADTLPPKGVFHLLIALVITYAIIKSLVLKQNSFCLNRSGFLLLGVTIGVLGPFVGAMGPILAPFFLRKELGKENIVATKSAMQLLGHLAKLPPLYYLGISLKGHEILLLLLCVATVIGTKVGNIILKNISTKIFFNLMLVFLAFAAMRFYYKCYVDFFS